MEKEQHKYWWRKLGLETIEFLEEDIRENLQNISFGSDFMDMTLKTQAMK